jgi:hypothetical protein
MAFEGRGRVVTSGGTLIHNEPFENREKIHGGVGLSHYNTTLIVYETGQLPRLTRVDYNQL